MFNLKAMTPFSEIGSIPFDLNVLSSLFPETEHINEKARRLEANGIIIRLKRGLYVASSDYTGKALNRLLIANHVYGPSYVSLQTALRHYGLIPERVHLTQSLTTKHSRDFETPIGNFCYVNCDKDYFPIGVRPTTEDGLTFLIATPEKSLCDLINCTKGVNLRFMKDVAVFLEEDIRFDMEALDTFDIGILEACVPYSRKSQNINTLIKYIKHERHL